MKMKIRLVFWAVCAAFALSLPAQAARPSLTIQTSAGAVKITPVYHACALIQAGGKNIYIDPASPANFTGLPHADFIIITDIHRDHMDPDSIAAIRKPGTEILAPAAV